MLALARALAVRERRANRDRGVHAGDDVGDRHAGALRSAARRVIGLAGDAHHPTHALDHEVVPRTLAIRARVAKPRDRAVDEPRVELTYLLIPEPVAREVAVLVVLNEDVRTLGELARDGVTLRRRDVERDRLLAAVGGGVIGRVLRIAVRAVLDPRGAKGARIISASRALDLDHLGTQV